MIRHSSLLFILFLGVFFVLHLPSFRPLLVNQDLQMMANSARRLIKTGNLADIGDRVLYQALREGNQEQPFWYRDFGPVLMYLPSFLAFGANDFAFFFVHTLLWVALLLAFAQRLGGLRHALIFFSSIIVLGGIERSTTVATNSLPFILATVLLWPSYFHPRDARHLGLIGLGLGVVFHFRMDTLFILLALVGAQATLSSQDSYLRRGVYLAGGVFLGFGTLAGLRTALGGTGSWDHSFINWGVDLYGKGFSGLSQIQIPGPTEFFAEPHILKLILVRFTRNLSNYAHFLGLGQRVAPFAFVWVFAVLGLLRFFSLRTFLVLAFLGGGQFLLLCLVYDDPRYLEHLYVLMGLVIYETAGNAFRARWRSASLLGVHALKGFSYAIFIGILSLNLYRTVRFRPFEREARAVVLARSEEAHRLIPADALVGSDDPAMWIWYGEGQRHVFAPGTGPGMQALLKRYPQMYIVQFQRGGRLNDEVEAFLVSRPRLVNRPDMRIFGPQLVAGDRHTADQK